MTGKISLALNILLAIAVIYLFTKIGGSEEEEAIEPLEEMVETEKIYPSIAYVNNDSLQLKFELMKDITSELKTYSDDITALESKFQRDQQARANLENDFYAKVQNGTYTTEAQVQAAQIEAGERAESLENELKRVQRNLESKYAKYQEKTVSLNDSLLSQVKKYVDAFSEENSIDMILLYTQNQNGLYANDKLDVTKEVVKGLNSQYAKDKAAVKKTP